MVVLVLVMAGLGFVLLIASLITGQTLFAWACIVACIVGAVVLLVGTLPARGVPTDGDAGAGDTDTEDASAFDDPDQSGGR